MVIQGEFFQLTPVNEHSLLWDLKLLYKVGGKNPREEYKEAGYGLTLDSALKKCINYAINQNFEILSLKEYLDEFRRLTTEIGLQIQGKPIQFN
jgi:hypothetical protein